MCLSLFLTLEQMFLEHVITVLSLVLFPLVLAADLNPRMET